MVLPRMEGAGMGGPGRIFIAYAREDKKRVRQLYRELKARGFDPWLDAIDLIPGQLWQSEIPKAIRQAGIFLACFSKIFVEKRGYVQKELRLALSTYAQMPHGSIWFIPVRLDDCVVPGHEIPDLNVKIEDFQWVDLWEKDGFDRLLAAIEYAVGKPHGGKLTLRDVDEPWCPELVVIPAGTFLMGSPEGEEGRNEDEGPQHEVKIAYSLAIGRYPVTFAEYDHFCAATGREKPANEAWGRGKRPVIKVSWRDAAAYCEWLSRETGKSYRLPSEAEWEYGCRAGTTSRYSCGDEITEDNANFGRKHGRTTEVGVYPANAFGIHDMHGNVLEWVLDEWHGDYSAAPSDGRAKTSDNNPTRRVLRGGSWFDHPRSLRSAARYWRSPSEATNKLGFRVCREV